MGYCFHRQCIELMSTSGRVDELAMKNPDELIRAVVTISIASRAVSNGCAQRTKFFRMKSVPSSRHLDFQQRCHEKEPLKLTNLIPYSDDDKDGPLTISRFNTAPNKQMFPGEPFASTRLRRAKNVSGRASAPVSQHGRQGRA
ncbi:unnamed protein product [Notodromas monacha]|uniref:Uncharacterized protein n=1 Tax=Notodromas monacha TaxID=399045 RepID=A0A7R9BDY0_9CRUS|nr:unnamed protein product [Notodromas monacha]CAG0912466.1 unnamed protein product [Notodromas monacha]